MTLDLTNSLDWRDGLPLPQWDIVQSWIDSRCAPGERAAAWTSVSRQWLGELGPALGSEGSDDVGDSDYEQIESPNFLALVPRGDPSGRGLLPFAERCRAALLGSLQAIARFDAQGKQVVLVMRDTDDYYRYVSLYHEDGEYGGSAGIHIREGRPHVVLQGGHGPARESTLAHELTHAALMHLSMPQWLEEGLAQMFEHGMTGQSPLIVDAEMAAKHKRYWGARGLEEFWFGEGFSSPGEVQKLSYQLAEILVRLLVEEGRPRWFGFAREPQRRFLAFLREAHIEDCGAEACRERLGYPLEELAGRFLGEGDWSVGR